MSDGHLARGKEGKKMNKEGARRRIDDRKERRIKDESHLLSRGSCNSRLVDAVLTLLGWIVLGLVRAGLQTTHT
jgi:hypothetical protein